MDQYLSMCSGIGGLDVGFEHGFATATGRTIRPVCYVEREAFAIQVLAEKIQNKSLAAAPIWCSDLRDLPVDELPRVDWITGGYPCQPFSAAGKRLGEDDSRHLWPVIFEQVRALRPSGVFFENVGGHLTLGLNRVLRDLAGCGFRCAFGLYTAAEVGAPHRRERVFIVGLADSSSNDRRLGIRSKEAGTREDEERRRGSAVRGAELADGDRGRLPEFGEAHDDYRRNECWNDARRCNKTVANAYDAGSQRRRVDLQGGHQWPSRPGCAQGQHEPPRTIESGLGGNPNGIPDRVDRLRALGNAVVPQQASRAFVDLWRTLEAMQ